MALWGKTDTLASAPKYVTRKAVFDAQAKVTSATDKIDLTDANTNFSTGDGVVYTGASGIGLTQGTAYYVMRQTDNTIKLATTEAGAKAGATGINLTAGATGAIGYLQRNVEGNEATGASGATGAPDQISNAGDHIYNGRDLYFIDADEATQAENIARGLKVPGWTNYRSYTDANGNVRHKSEVLVAMGAYAGATGFGTFQAQTDDNAADDTVLVDGTITIGTQPLSQSKVAGSGAGNKGVFVVAATLAGVGTLAYQWQVQESSESGATWTNVSRGSGGTTATYTTGNTAVTASPTGDTNGDKYRVIVSATGGAVTSVTSSTAVLTVTAS
jgi:hypothetical protein